MEVIIDGVAYVPKEKSELEIMKEKYERGEYIAVTPTDTGRYVATKKNIRWDLWTIKLIHKKHKDILDAYLEDNSVEIESTYNIAKEYGFIESYNEDYDYRLKPKEWYEIESNFPCVATDGKDFVILDSKFCETWMMNRFANLRPATKGEVLSLLVEP